LDVTDLPILLLSPLLIFPEMLGSKKFASRLHAVDESVSTKSKMTCLPL